MRRCCRSAPEDAARDGWRTGPAALLEFVVPAAVSPGPGCHPMAMKQGRVAEHVENRCGGDVQWRLKARIW